MALKKWEVTRPDIPKAQKLAEESNLPILLACLLIQRGLDTSEKIQSFLSDETSLSDPFIIADMDKAAQRIHDAINKYEKIAVFGDYDADGVTATTVLFSYMETFGANVMYYIPDRATEGYGMNQEAVHELHRQGVDLIVTVDNGISAVEEIELANSLGIDTVVTDHHQPPPILPKAFAIVNPHRKDCPSLFKDLSGVGVVLKLILALEETEDSETVLDNYADLAAIGTIGDIVPLTGENRIIVKRGLKMLGYGERSSLASLLSSANTNSHKITAGNLAYSIVPRINAAGRLGDSGRAVRLLLSEDTEEIAALSEEITTENYTRQGIEEEIIKEIREEFGKCPHLAMEPVLIIYGENWHHGVLGIAASRIQDIYGKPCIILAGDTDSTAKGSGRSLRGFNLHKAIQSASHLLLRFGGHPMAAGLALKQENIDAFRQAVLNYAKTRDTEMPVPILGIDCTLKTAALTYELASELERLAPFGAGNPSPIFGLFGVQIRELFPLKDGKHTRVTFIRDGKPFKGVMFGISPEDFPQKPGDTADLAVSLERSEYRGSSTLSIIIYGVRKGGFQPELQIYSKRRLEKLLRGEKLTKEEALELLPNRTELGRVYRLFQPGRAWSGTHEALFHKAGDTLDMGKLLLSLYIFEELGLLRLETDWYRITVELYENKEKQNLNDSNLLQVLQRIAEG